MIFFFQNQSGTLTFDWTFWIDLGWVVFLNSFPISDCQARMVVMHQSGCKIPTAENLDWHWLQLIFLCRSLTSVFDAICSSRAPVCQSAVGRNLEVWQKLYIPTTLNTDNCKQRFVNKNWYSLQYSKGQYCGLRG